MDEPLLHLRLLCLKGEETVFVRSVTQKHVTFHALDLDYAIFTEDRPVVYLCGPSGLGPGVEVQLCLFSQV